MVDTITFSQMPSGGDLANNEVTPGLQGGANVLFNNPWTFLPPGTTAQRPVPSSAINYRLRFNTDNQLYEYYDAVLGMWTQIQESAFTVGPFITYTADASLPDAQNLGALANGILKQTITTGVATLNIAVNGTDYYGPGFVVRPADGGTGVNNGALTINLGSATTGFVLTSDSSGNATWQSVSASGGITTIDGDSGAATPLVGVVTISGASTGLTFTGASHTVSLGGLLNSTFGGTGVSVPTAHGIMVAEGASPMTPIVLSSGQILIGSTGADPVAAAINSGTGILVGNGAGSITVSLAAIPTLNILSNITGGSAAPIANTLTATIDAAIGSTQGDILYRNATVWTILAPGTAGQFLTTGGAAANVSWTSQVAPTGQALTEVNDTNVTMTLGGSPSTALLAATSMTLGWTGQLSIARGGTAVSSVTTSPAATAWAGWDANKNLAENNFLPGYATTVTAAATTTLLVGSPYYQFFTGSTTQTILLPVTSTLALGQSFYIVNNSSGVVTVQSSGANNVQVMASGTSVLVTVISTSGTTAASWNADYAQNGGSGSGTVNSGTQYNLAYYAATGTAVSGLANAGSSGLALLSGSPPAWSTLPPITRVNVQVFTSGGTYTPTTGMQYCVSECVGGGGAGASAAAGTPVAYNGGGGGSGSYSRKLSTAAAIGASQTVTIGAGGTPGAAGANPGGAGGDTSIGSICIGKGGGGGGASAGVVGRPGAAGAGGIAGTGDFTPVGNPGGLSNNGSVGYVNGVTSFGGNSIYGGGGAMVDGNASDVAGNAGSNYGAGGSGASAFTTAKQGGAGSAGVVIITEYISV